MFNPDQKRLLALDGGGILGAISLRYLKAIEDQITARHGLGDDFRLRDYFDYIGGTSTGAIIAAGLAIGKSVDELIAFYSENGADMFQRARLWKRWRQTYRHSALSNLLRKEFHHKSIHALQKDGMLSKQKHLLVVARNVETDSPWPISTNRKAKYNSARRKDCNLNIPLWQLVRASTAAPTFFAPERLQWDPSDPDKQFYFEDGGVTPYNNPAFLLFRMATLPEYKCAWPTGEDKMMLISIGTGTAFRQMSDPDPDGEGLLTTAQTVASELMRGMAVENDINCRTVGRCVFGAPIDREIGDLVPKKTAATHRAFLYARFNPDTSQEGLDAMGLDHIDAATLEMDNVDAIDAMLEIGRKGAEREVHLEAQFPGF